MCIRDRDLTTQAGLSVQQDLALVNLLGLGHVERNGHHFIDGMGFASQDEQKSFARAHPSLYRLEDGKPARLRIDEGKLRLDSLDCSGFAVSGEMDFASMTARREGDTQNFDLAPLKPARLVITSESNAHETLNPAKIKQITGGNFIRCSFKLSLIHI